MFREGRNSESKSVKKAHEANCELETDEAKESSFHNTPHILVIGPKGESAWRKFGDENQNRRQDDGRNEKHGVEYPASSRFRRKGCDVELAIDHKDDRDRLRGGRGWKLV